MRRETSARRTARFALGAVARLAIVAGLLIGSYVAFELWGTAIPAARAQDEVTSSLPLRTGLPEPVLAGFFPPFMPPPFGLWLVGWLTLRRGCSASRV